MFDFFTDKRAALYKFHFKGKGQPILKLPTEGYDSLESFVLSGGKADYVPAIVSPNDRHYAAFIAVHGAPETWLAKRVTPAIAAPVEESMF